jgi:hypothetical protein
MAEEAARERGIAIRIFTPTSLRHGKAKNIVMRAAYDVTEVISHRPNRRTPLLPHRVNSHRFRRVHVTSACPLKPTVKAGRADRRASGQLGHP